MTQRKQWSDFTTGQQSGMVLAAGLEFAFLSAALWDIWHRLVEEIQGDRRLWTVASLVSFVGPLAYFFFGRKDCC